MGCRDRIITKDIDWRIEAANRILHGWDVVKCKMCLEN